MKYFTLILLALLSSKSLSDCSPGVCGNVMIDRLYVKSSGVIYIGTDGDESVLTCGAVSGVYVTIPADAPGKDALYSTLLAAQLAGKRITTLQVQDTEPGCLVQYITLDSQ